MNGGGLERSEWKLVLGTGGAYALRMLGLYMALPVLATWAGGLPGATPTKVGLAVGAYGLTQAIFQVPFGVLSDLVGRRFIIFLSLVLFAAGSAVISRAEGIDTVILGRLLQGTGAMASTIIALVGDGTREEARARAMAVLGVLIGGSFAGGFLAGPQVAARIGVAGVFAAASVLSLIAAIAFHLLVPASLVRRPAAAAASPNGLRATPRSWSWPAAWAALRDPSLLVLDAGVGVLHASVTGALVVVPFVMRDHLEDRQLWIAYAPAIASAMAAMGWASRRAAAPGRARRILALGGAACGAGLLGLAFLQRSVVLVAGSLAVFMSGFAMLEPVLAALLTQHTERASRGTAAGVFNLVQFLGVFLGGLVAGRLLGFGRWAPFVAMALILAGWVATLRWLREPGARGSASASRGYSTTTSRL